MAMVKAGVAEEEENEMLFVDETGYNANQLLWESRR